MNPRRLNLKERILKGDPEMVALYADEAAKLDIALQIRNLREAAGLSQSELARRVGTSPSAISRLENANYAGHSMLMLRRIASALGKRIELRFVDAEVSEPTSEAA